MICLMSLNIVKFISMQMQIYNSCDILNINEGIRKMNYDLGRVWQWATGNGLSLNKSKSKSIFISRTKFDYSVLSRIVFKSSTNSKIYDFSLIMTCLGVLMSVILLVRYTEC